MQSRTVRGFTTILMLFLSGPFLAGFAQEMKQEAVPSLETGGRWHIEGTLLIGAGLDDHKVGITTDNKDITISGGGGVGGVVAFGYGLSPKFDLNFGLGIEVSSLQPQVKNAEGDFQRSFMDATLKYRIPVSPKGHIKIGGGAGYYMPSDMDLDLSKVTGGAHNIYAYDPATGFHMMVEYEGFFREKISWNAGLKYTSTSYKLKSVKSNGITVPIPQLPNEIRKEMEELDGSGIELILSFNFYF